MSPFAPDVGPGQIASRLAHGTQPWDVRMPRQAFSVAIVDDQPVTRTGFEKVVLDDPRLRVLTSAGSADELDDDDGQYDVILFALPPFEGESSLDLIGRIAKVSPTVVTLTWERAPTAVAAIKAGARGCVTRQSSQETVAEAIWVAANGGMYICPRLTEAFTNELSRLHEDEDTLAPREIETLCWIARGLTQTQIAKRMGLTPATVNTYAKRVRSKLNAGNKAELTRLAIELGYLSHGRRHLSAVPTP